MNHLIVCREYPSAPYPPGGIGTYVAHISRLLAEAGDTVHVIAQRWEGASARVAESCGGKADCPPCFTGRGTHRGRTSVV